MADGTQPNDTMFDAIGRQKLRSRDVTASITAGELPMLAGLDSATKTHRQIMDNLRRSTRFNEVELTQVVAIFDQLAIPGELAQSSSTQLRSRVQTQLALARCLKESSWWQA